MDIFSYDVPLLGQSFLMFSSVVRFRVPGGWHISFYSEGKNEPLRCPIFTRHTHHKKLLDFLRGGDVASPFLLTRESKRRHMLSMDKHVGNIRHFVGVVRTLFQCEYVMMEVCLSADENYMGRCDFHPLDLYEMGYATRTPAIVLRPTAIAGHDPHVHTGFSVYANNPLLRYPEDYVHLELSCRSHHGFLLVSLENLATHRPDVASKLSPVIADILKSIPLRQRKGHDAFMEEWRLHHWFEVRPQHLTISVRDWKPGLFLHHFARLLDIFSSYTLTQRFTLDFVF